MASIVPFYYYNGVPLFLLEQYGSIIEALSIYNKGLRAYILHNI